MRINSIEELAQFTRKQWIKSKFTQFEIAEKLDSEQSEVSKALNIKTPGTRRISAMRIDILRCVGWNVQSMFIARRIRPDR